MAGCIVAAVIADKKGRSGVGFFFLSALLSLLIGTIAEHYRAGAFPLSALLSLLIGIIAAWVATPDTKVLEARIKAREFEMVAAAQGKRCPYCAEIIRPEAVVCRFCGKEQPAQEVSAPAGDAKQPQEGSWVPEKPDAAWRKEQAVVWVMPILIVLIICALAVGFYGRLSRPWYAATDSRKPAIASTEDDLATIISLKGHICSAIEHVRKLENQDAYEVTCLVINSPGDEAERNFLVSLKNRTAIPR